LAVEYVMDEINRVLFAGVPRLNLATEVNDVSCSNRLTLAERSTCTTLALGGSLHMKILSDAERVRVRE
jgi:hypothetical protein